MDNIEKIIRGLLNRGFYEKFTKDRKIWLKNYYEFLKKEVGLVWLEEKPFLNKAKKILNQYYVKLNKYKKYKKLQQIQKKYKKLKITEAFFYLSLKEKFMLKNEDLETFEEMLEILFSELKKENKQK